jgi:hypothetical protein
VYRVHPWQMERWTGNELADLAAYHRARERARREAEEG